MSEVRVYRDDHFSFDGSPDELISLIKEKSSLVPKDRAHAAKITIETWGSYEFDYIGFEVTYESED